MSVASCVALLACVVGAGACSSGEEAAPAATVRVEQGAIERLVVATGTLEPEREVEVRPRTAGIVERIHVEAGDRVAPEQVLLELERELLEAQVREARAAVEAARVERQYAHIDAQRVATLGERGAASVQKLDEARARYEKGAAALAEAEARLAFLDVQLGYTVVRAPLAGTVLDVFVEEGNAVSPVTAVTGGTLLLSIAGGDTIHLEGLVDENEIARVRTGQPARLRTEAFGDRVFQGRVRKIAPLGQRVQNVTYFEVEVEITDPDATLLRPRMSGDADIVTEVVADAVIVPETALRYRGAEVQVDVLAGDGPGDVVPRTVELGILEGARVQVLSGVEPGEQVVLP
ncbi:efflux RND transporter periplasmic adaptor subunit [Myxococcota bacterium]|nr:efflux RND transporter periplasmic adaptor subunit [Myxococcota bacterium]MCZ7619679.1 efflux RND transporter periplasmic adaptor subunit [Myxococcota bacterium]